MAEINTFPKSLRTNSVSSIQDSTSMPSSPRSISPASNWVIQYKPTSPKTNKGVWGGYETQEEFMTMHLR
ncbi:hypothetical protein I4U23_007413 [Adineta vaga]|nr:hypothetical protein I4U23_007413 [Adineta vaga]